MHGHVHAHGVILAGGNDSIVRCFDVRLGLLMKQFTSHQSVVTDILLAEVSQKVVYLYTCVS